MNVNILIVFFVIFYHTQNVSSTLSFFDKIVAKLKDIGNKILSGLKNVGEKIKGFFNSRHIVVIGSSGLQEDKIEEKTRRILSDLIENESTPDTPTNIPDFLNLESEPTALMTTPQLAKHHGKTIETHIVITGDGYILTIHRLVHPEDQPPVNQIKNPTVLLHHGLLGSSADWILLGEEKSLPYILSDIGYDVWMTNARGNYYSRGHVSTNIRKLQYWKFSWQEMGKYDLSAVVDYIRKLKNSNETINFIGHSMGATALLVLLSTTPHYNEYFRMGILLAPLAYMSNIDGPLKIFSPLAENLPKDILRVLGDGEFFPSKKIPTWIVNKYCKGAHVYCSNPLLFLSGTIPDENTWDASLLARVLNHVPAGGSTNTILHYAQLARTGKFQKFEENTEFPLKKVTLPIALFTSSDDWLATIPDVLKLYFSIANPIDHYVIRGKNLSHLEFVFGPNAPLSLYKKVTRVLEHGFEKTVTLNEV